MPGRPKKAQTRVVHGDALLYRFFLEFSQSQPEQFARIAQPLIESVAIWLPLELYRRSPVLMPWLIRDRTARGDAARNIPEQWGSPNSNGYMRADNSPIKNIRPKLTARGPQGSRLNGAELGTEFVASHIWRVNHTDKLASQVPQLNSFVPNLVWLPRQVSKLSDIEGSRVQKTLQAMSLNIYRDAPLRECLRTTIDEVWSLLPSPSIEVEVNPDRLNWFVAPERFVLATQANLKVVIAALRSLAVGEELTGRVITSRYKEGLPEVSESSRRRLLEFLLRFDCPEP
jgi:hypothetical protein